MYVAQDLTQRLYGQGDQILPIATMHIPPRRHAVLCLILQHSVDDAVEIPSARISDGSRRLVRV
jgi:hypothetical protein